MSCHAASALGDPPPGRLAEIVLVGHPNVGKSVLFGRLTGRYVTVANYPGTTVDVFRGAARAVDGAAVIDTPGIVGFPARSEDEQVVSRLLLDGEERTLVQVGDAKGVRRTLQLTVQLAELGLPLVLVLNMSDEAAAAGVRIDRQRLSELLGVPVLLTVATEGTGVGEIAAAVSAALPARARVVYPAPVEEALAELGRSLGETPVATRGETPVATRGAGLLWLGGDEEAQACLERQLPADLLVRVRERAEQALGEPAAAALQRARSAYADEVVAEAVRQEPRPAGGVLERLGRLSTHRVWGWPVLAAVFYAVYWFVGVLGAGRLVGLLENSLFGRHVNPWLTHEVTRLVPSSFLADLLVGKYGLWTMGMTYALALILPIVTTFFLVFSVLEDSGYLPRLAVVSNRLFHALGLNGKAALPMVLGLGCVTMATLTTRILESRRERLLVTLLLALGIPCSAQLGVVLGMLGSISPAATLIWGGVVAAVVFAVGWLAARVVPGERSPLLIELPPLRVPRPANVLTKTLMRLEWYLREVIPLFLAGTAFLFVLDKTGALPAIIDGMRPLVTGWLGLPPAASAAFLIGFLRRDFGAAGLFVLHAQGRLSPEQAVVAMVTITLFIPCVASILIIVRERGAAQAAAMTATVFPLAFLVGGLLHHALVAVGWGA
ncbi:MAG TPA: ferrous iron transport protein B [Gaiellaceae bacterium]